MPLTKTGEKVLEKMKETYKDNELAEEVFYSSINKGKPGTEKWHKVKKGG